MLLAFLETAARRFFGDGKGKALRVGGRFSGRGCGDGQGCEYLQPLLSVVEVDAVDRVVEGVCLEHDVYDALYFVLEDGVAHFGFSFSMVFRQGAYRRRAGRKDKRKGAVTKVGFFRLGVAAPCFYLFDDLYL